MHWDESTAMFIKGFESTSVPFVQVTHPSIGYFPDFIPPNLIYKLAIFFTLS